jgi:hypothetical protein
MTHENKARVSVTGPAEHFNGAQGEELQTGGNCQGEEQTVHCQFECYILVHICHSIYKHRWAWMAKKTSINSILIID